ncbi:MAG TPA: CRISPR-associated endoribonuclease Cas6, partial [Niabella sp.]|nr:CRISPR-associated endoribonuclease Cas6 [Niabella sp.]
KIEAAYNPATASGALLMAESVPMKHPPRSRLITIKEGRPEETKIRGWMNMGLELTGEKRFVELLLNAGAGLYNAMGCGCVQVSEHKRVS